MPWDAIRSLYHFGTKSDGTNVFEERIVGIEATDFDAAHRKGEAESKEYAEATGFSVHPDQMAYEQDGKTLIDGYELWSELFESSKDLDTFWQERYEQYLYHPE